MSKKELCKFIKIRMIRALEDVISDWVRIESKKIFNKSNLYGWNVFLGFWESLFEQRNFSIEKKRKCVYINKDFILHSSEKAIKKLFHECVSEILDIKRLELRNLINTEERG